MNNLNEDHMYQSNGLDTKFLPKLNNTHETNLFIPKPGKYIILSNLTSPLLIVSW